MYSVASYTIHVLYFFFQNSLSTSVGGGYGGATASVGFSIKDVNQNINQLANSRTSQQRFTIGSREVPLPIHLKLIPITKALDKIWWGARGWRRKRIAKKQRNLAKALRDYPRNVNASINEGNAIIIISIAI